MTKIQPKIKEEQKELMIRILGIIFEEKIGKDKTNELINKLRGGEEKMVSPIIEMIRKENQMYIDIGKRKIIKSMLEEGLPISLVAKISKLDEKEIEKINNSK